MDSRRDLKWENQILVFQKATGEVFSDRLKCAIVKISSSNQDVLASSEYGALRLALMNYLEAEDDGHGPVPMEVGAMKGKKGNRDKKGYGKGKFGKSLGKYDKSNEHSKNTNYGKGSEKGKRKREEIQMKRTRKRQETSATNFQEYCWSCGKWGHKASECRQGYVQAVEEVPSSSASSVAPSAATTPAAAKKAASIQEFNDEQEPGWFFGVMGGSVASVTTGTDDLWEELVLDSGSVSKACPYVWCWDICGEQRRQCVSARHSATQNPISWIKGGTSRIVGPEGRVECKVKLMLQMLRTQLCRWER